MKFIDAITGRKKQSDAAGGYAGLAGKLEAANRVNRGAKALLGAGGQISTEKLSELQRDNAIAKQIADVPIEDALRNWRFWSGTDEQAKAIAALEVRLGVHGAIKKAACTARLYGGAVILIRTTGVTDYSQPLNADTIRENDLISLSVFGKGQFSRVELDDDSGSPTCGQPLMFHFNGNATGTGKETTRGIHPSHLAIFRGESILMNRGSTSTELYWGDSVLRSRAEGILDLVDAYANMILLLREAKSPTLSIPDLANLLGTPEGLIKLQAIVNGFNIVKGNTGLNTIDTQMEFKNNDYTFTGIKDIVEQARIRVAAEADIPATKLFGTSSVGLNATGQGDADNYRDRLRTEQAKLSDSLVVLDRVLARSALGNAGSGLVPKWNPLQETSEAEKSAIFMRESQVVMQLLASNLITEAQGKDLTARLLTNAGIQEQG